jgi:NAD(P)-dependent dehydrogenase (short-subunit alcohol dehydrogenase family)
MELGEHNITANALIPGLIDTALTRDEKRLSESNCEQGQEVEHPTPQQASDNRAPTVPSRSVGWLRPTTVARCSICRLGRRNYGDRRQIRSYQRQQRQGYPNTSKGSRNECE